MPPSQPPAGWHRDPELVERNRLPMSALPPPDDPDSRLLLDGPWRFRHHLGPVPDTDWVGDAEPDWDTLDLPASWVLAGSGIPIYTNVQYPFPIDGYPEIPLDDETGDHWRRVDVPADWVGRRIVLHLGAAESAVEVWVGGRWVGCSTDSRLPAAFDVSGFVTPGEAVTVALRVHRWSASTWLEDQDMWWMAGIHRSIVLYATDPVRVRDAVFTTDELAPDGGSARVTIGVAVDDGGEPVDDIAVVATLTDPDGAAVVDGLVLGADPDRDGWYRSTIEVTGPATWTAETPHLHRLELEATIGGEVLDRCTLSVGIRTVAVDGGALLVNGAPVTIRGVNRHEHDAERGRVQSDELLANDIALLQAANINAVRTAHYPDDERFYDLCDRAGIYVMDEANIESHGLVGDPDRLPADDPRFAEAFVERTRRMVERDRNHPCVIAWSLGNESGLGANHRLAAAAARAVDPNRPIAYHPGEDDEVVDIIGPMYPTIGELEALAAAADHRPVIMCEYSHAMGNSNGGLADYWDVIRTNHRLGGGFIWDWVDQGLARTTDDGVRWWAYGGDFDDKPNDRNFNLNGLVDADRRAHPALLHVAWVYRPVAVVPGHRFLPAAGGGPVTVIVENRRSHVDLGDLAGRWTLLIGESVVASGDLDGSAIPAGTSIERTIDLPPIEVAPGVGDARLRVEWRSTDPATTGVDWEDAPDRYRGLVAWDELALPVGRPTLPPTSPPAPPASSATRSSPAADAPTVETTDAGVVLRAATTEITIDAVGQPTRLVLGATDVGLLDARLGTWRAPTDNDDATFGPDRVVTRLRRAGLEDVAFEPAGDPEVVVRGDVAEVRLPLTIAGAGVRAGCRWLVDGAGDVAVELSVVAGLDVPPLLRFGFELDLPPRYRSLAWFGPGPVETYPDRVRGLFVDRHAGSVDDQLFPYGRPQESGNHTELRWLALTADDGSGILAVGDPRFDGAALPIGARALTEADHLHEISWPDHTVLRLDAANGGLGTASCGPGVDRRFEVDARFPISNRIVLRSLGQGDDPGLVAAPPSPLRRIQRWHYGDAT
ncbi:MAG: glycoside hydrolase family 2 TIM barrel-domain containing protein [Actinomycetota bacterium]